MPPTTEARVVFCGVLNYQPNVDAAVRLGRRIWPRVLVTRPDARMSLVGASPTPTVVGLGQDPTIEVTGTVPDVRPYLWKASISVAPLETGRGLQNKALEAIAAGLPVIVSPLVLGGLPPAVRPACIVADSDDAMVNAIIELLALTPAQRRERAQEADFHGLSWAEQLRPLWQVLEDAVNRQGQRCWEPQESSLSRVS